MEASEPLSMLLIVLALLLLVLFGAASSLGVLAMFVPAFRPWLIEQIQRLLGRR